MIISATTLQQMDSRQRVNTINSLSGFKSASLIGTVSGRGGHNLAIISSVVHLGADPALVGFIMRPHVTRRDTLENILETGVYTINHIHTGMIAQAHQTAARYDAQVSEFDETGLTPEITAHCAAPYVKESRIRYALRFVEKMDIKSNGTHLIIGEVTEIQAPDGCLDSTGKLDLEAAGTVAISGLDQYHSTATLDRFSYAKPGKALVSLLHQ
ncbi:MAG: flavin reductase family protein [Marinobacterium sp.]|nr:flavin reductase family protein [Marinobacterium sp.]